MNGMKRITMIALMIALAYVGSLVKVPGTSIALDSMPAFLASIVINPVAGAIVGASGHFLSALTSGFPMSLPIHLIIMVLMAVTVYVFGVIVNSPIRNQFIKYLLATASAVILNGPVSLIAVSFVAGKGVFALMPLLVMAALVNVLLAFAVSRTLVKVIKQYGR